MVAWGDWRYSGGNGMRVGVVGSTSNVTHTSTKVKFIWEIWTQNQYRYADNQTLNYSRDVSGSTNFGNYENPGVKRKRATKSYTYYYPSTSYGSSPGTGEIKVRLTGAYNGVNPSKVQTRKIPKRPYAKPAAPTGFSAARNGETSIAMSWTRHPTNGEPYHSHTVWRRQYGTTWSSWVSASQPSGTATSFTQTGCAQYNLAYQFALRANNPAGSSAWTYSSVIYMKPAQPQQVNAARYGVGTSVNVDWVRDDHNWSGTTFRVQRSQNSGAWVTMTTTAGLTYLDPDAGSGSVQYRVLCIGPGSLESPYTESSVVTVTVPPLAPTNLLPDDVVDLSKDITLTWTHVPGGDGTPQTMFKIDTSINDGGSWQPLVTDVLSAVSSHLLPADTFTNTVGSTVWWRVATKGPTGEDYSGWSNHVTMTGRGDPTATLVAEFPPAILINMPFAVQWLYNQDEGSVQIRWEARVTRLSDSIVVYEDYAEDDSTETNVEFPLVDGESYDVEVRVWSSDRRASEWDSTQITIDLLPPAMIHIEPTYDLCTGTMALSVSSDVPEEGVTETVHSIIVKRKVSGGDWLILYQGEADTLPEVYVDVLPLTNGDNEYKVQATADTGSVGESVAVTVPGTDGDTSEGLWVFLSYGSSFFNVLRVRGDLRIDETGSRSRGAQHFLGRKLPLLTLGTNVNRKVSVGGVLHYADKCDDGDLCLHDSAPSAWIEAGKSAGLVCYRDYTGRRYFGKLSDVSVDEAVWPGHATVSFDVTEVEFQEQGLALLLEEE